MAFPGSMPYGQPQMLPPAQPQSPYQPSARQVTTLPRPSMTTSATPRPRANLAATPQPPRSDVLPVEVPAPEQLGIRLAAGPVVVPDPAAVGVRLE